jgi:hypothetical protein
MCQFSWNNGERNNAPEKNNPEAKSKRLYIRVTNTSFTKTLFSVLLVVAVTAKFLLE